MAGGRPHSGRRPFAVRLLPATVDLFRLTPDEEHSSVIRRLMAAGMEALSSAPTEELDYHDEHHVPSLSLRLSDPSHQVDPELGW